ncbi:MAG: hypothetical protein KK926_09585 [Methanomethylovorans sp.]|nr:hypothetical protein [Methanomethylovorans sp.]
MKRLTISMSDALFDKLNQVDNKSLFIRKLIEGELRKGIAYSSDAAYESLAGDIEDLHHEIRSLSSRLASIENQIVGIKTDPFFTKDVSESDLAASYQISSLPLSENGDGTSVAQTTVVDSYSMINELNEVTDKDMHSISDNILDIQVNLSPQESDKVLPVHSDEMHNIPFRSVVNVGAHKGAVCPVTETNETPVNSMIITPGMADQLQESPSAQENKYSTPSFVMPELSDVPTPPQGPFVAASPEPSVPSTPSFVMPELSDVPTPSQSPFVAASPEPSVPSTPLFVMPELGAMEHPNISSFELPPSSVMPSSENDIQMPSFVAPDVAASGVQMQPQSFLMQETQPRSLSESAIIQTQIQNNDSSNFNTVSMSANTRLQGNILMYLPHGARIKRSIIKGLVSKKFSAEEIDAEVDLMVSDKSLLVEVEDGVEYLLRP